MIIVAITVNVLCCADIRIPEYAGLVWKPVVLVQGDTMVQQVQHADSGRVPATRRRPSENLGHRSTTGRNQLRLMKCADAIHIIL